MCISARSFNTPRCNSPGHENMNQIKVARSFFSLHLRLQAPQGFVFYLVRLRSCTGPPRRGFHCSSSFIHLWFPFQVIPFWAMYTVNYFTNINSNILWLLTLFLHILKLNPSSEFPSYSFWLSIYISFPL